MGRITTKVLAGIGIFTVIGLMKSHGLVDMQLYDATVNTAKEVASQAVESSEGQELIGETKEIATDVVSTAANTLLKGTKKGLDIVKEEADLFDEENEDEEKGDDGEGIDNDDSVPEEILEKASLEKVVDGDTLLVKKDGEEIYVRFIGIDTPESVNPDEKKNSVYGGMASTYAKELLSGVRKVYLQYDIENTDKYGRTLAYVWLNDDVDVSSVQDISNYMMNAILISDGYAIDRVYAPNIRYSDVFEELREKAEQSKTGLWQSEDFSKLWNE